MGISFPRQGMGLGKYTLAAQDLEATVQLPINLEGQEEA